ncbi:MAG: hypothetical protein ACX94B_03270 [Henriciella sp.]|nr:hypothetical protein [Hyphomonadaceae bacterium]
MKKLMIGAAASVLIAACGGAETPTEVTIAEPVLKELTVRTGDPAQAANALAAMSLTDSGSGVLSFAGSTTDGATATFTDLTITGEDAVKVGSLVLEGLDMEGDQANFGKMSLNDITISEEGEDAEVKLGSIELINPSPELAGWLAASLNGQEVPFPAADKIVFDSWSMNGLTGEFSDTEAEGTFGIDKIEIRDMSDLKAAQAVLSGLSVNGSDMSEGIDFDMSLASFSATNVDAKFVKAIQENVDDEDAMMSAIMDLAYENPMEPGYDSFTMDDLKIDVAGASFAIPSLVSGVERNAAGQPVKFVTQPYSMTLKADAAGGEAGEALLQGLSVVGYEELELKGAGIASYDPDQDIVSFDAGGNYIELVDGAKISFGGKIEGYAEANRKMGAAMDFETLSEGGEPDPMVMQDAFSGLTFHNFELSIADNSLLDRAFNAAATAQGADPTELKSQIGMGLAMAPMMAQGSGVDMALVTEATSALSSFINDGGTLTLKLEPETPLSVASIMANPDPAAYTKETLGFTATQK